MLKQKPCRKGFLQLPPEKPAAQWGADLTPGVMQNNMGIFPKETSTFLRSRVCTSAALGISSYSDPQPLTITHTHQELPRAVYSFVLLFKSQKCRVIS